MHASCALGKKGRGREPAGVLCALWQRNPQPPPSRPGGMRAMLRAVGRARERDFPRARPCSTHK